VDGLLAILNSQLIGVIAGGVLGFGGAYLLQRHAQQKQDEERLKVRRSLRALLRAEIDRNRNRLRDYAEYLEAPEGSAGKLSMRTRAQRLVDRPLRPWWHSMWEGQAQHLGTVLNATEIVETADFHANLDALSDRWGVVDTLCRKRDADLAENDAKLAALHYGAINEDRARHNEQEEVIWKQFDRDIIPAYQGIQDALYVLEYRKGNPIGPDD
jgi:hypothetical protein